ncbi:excinuclease ABC subunit A [Aestuariicoccus sp. MJ-SS9]|uniref:excinuclease ABC subunit A n=1 Tax=Aestuariicoccus sp. MJ-SS9 TaxID=3079855 RepID=UPI002912525C|nr:excinuclease ABC subunit A [Aestuariicoccus sp. MJ-SS9]MDU8912702.1 excinuclease ABC subunit A [Aestuariicoccus sp. MJ-SS9]
MHRFFLTCAAALALAAPVAAAPKDCPPGLAKKSPSCVPPGQAKRYGVGERIGGEYRVIRDPGRWDLDPDSTYYRVGDFVYRVDRETREVLDLIGAVAAVLD